MNPFFSSVDNLFILMENGLKNQQSAFRWGTLCTISGNHPEGRTVVVRDITRINESFIIFTHEHSKKCLEISTNNQYTLVLFDRLNMIQFRLKGEIELVKDGPLYRHYVDQLSDEQKPLYAGFPPGIDWREPISTDHSPIHFMLLEGKIKEIDVLQIHPNNTQERFLFSKSGQGWNSKKIVP